MSDRLKIKLPVKVLFFLTSAIITVFLIPGSGKFRYEFQKGEPWKHNTLIADYDFPVYKSDEDLKAEKDSILFNVKPYYIFNDNVYKTAQRALNEDLDALLYGLTVNQNQTNQKRIQANYNENVRIPLTEKLMHIYAKGILENLPSSTDMKFSTSEFFKVKDNIAELTGLNDVYSQKTAYIELKEFYHKLRSDLNYDIQEFDFANYVHYNLIYDENTTLKITHQQLDDVSPVRGMIKEGERIIYKGQLINDERYQILYSLKKTYQEESGLHREKMTLFFSRLFLITSVFSVLFFYLFFYNMPVFEDSRKLLYFLVLTITFIILVSLTAYYELNVYLVPVTVLPVISASFFKPRTAFLHHITTIVLLGFIVSNSFEFIVIQFVAGFVAIAGISRMNRRSQILWTALFIFLAYFLLYFSITIVKEGNIDIVDLSQVAVFAGSSVLVLMAYPLIYFFEKIFGFISDVTLIELSDTNRPLLRLLAEKAPGTFQHTVQVANICEEAAREIDANPLLVRAGAMYHDIGKMNNPMYFIENQYKDNPHDSINPLKSAEIIKKHVEDGIKIAKKYRIPQDIIDFIPSHHGNSKIAWFLHKYKQLHDNSDINENEFKHTGILPYSKETAILMIVDSVEAASRSLKVYTKETIEELVDQIVANKISENLLIKADITFADIHKVKKVLKNKLITIYHARIEYPK